MTQVYNVRVIFDGTEDGCINLKENWLVLSNMTWRIWQIFVHRLKNSDFILESKMAELNKNKNSKEPHQPDAVWKIYFALEIKE